MLPLLITLAVVAAVLVGRRVARRRRRARERQTMFVTSVPSIELEQPYGGWDADAFDAYTGHGAPRGHLCLLTGFSVTGPPPGPPSTWARLP
ncbi:MAG TPA: hypothetical protein VFH38_08280 [Jatrophihabitans sp.]|nr:hypothetical protein [Jatrophihabitans sp.]